MCNLQRYVCAQDTSEPQIGVLAQELQETHPNAVHIQRQMQFSEEKSLRNVLCIQTDSLLYDAIGAIQHLGDECVRTTTYVIIVVPFHIFPKTSAQSLIQQHPILSYFHSFFLLVHIFFPNSYH